MIVAQVSDIHAAPGNNNLVRFDRALSSIVGIEPDAVVVSGDLIDDGWTEGYAEIAARLEALNCLVLLLPGNSDDRRTMDAVFTTRPGTVDDGDAMHFDAEVGGLRLIGLDVSVPGAAHGDVARHLDWLGRSLDAADAHPTLLFMHHHVVPSGIPPLDEVIAGGSEELGDLLADRSVRPLAIASGHVHRPLSPALAGVPAHVCGSICPANPLWFGGADVPAVNEPPMIMVHHLKDDRLVSSHIAV